MKLLYHLLLTLTLVVLGAGLAAQGVRLATTRPRPQSLGGMVLAVVGAALAIAGLGTLLEL